MHNKDTQIGEDDIKAKVAIFAFEKNPDFSVQQHSFTAPLEYFILNVVYV